MAGHRHELTISEDNAIADVVALRVQEGLNANQIAARLGIHPAVARRLLGQPAARQAVDEAIRDAADMARVKLADSAVAVAERMVALTVDGDEPRDPVQLKACEAVLDRLGMGGASKQGQVTIGQINVDARVLTPEQKAEAMRVYLDTIGEDVKDG